MDIESRNKLKKEIKAVLEKIFGKNGEKSFNVGASRKKDDSIVTLVDLEISAIVHKMFPDFRIYCEETAQEWSKQSDLRLDRGIILDPIDGTSSLAKGCHECVVSFALSDGAKPYGWIFNPFTGFEIYSEDNFVKPVHQPDKRLFGFVSRTELDKKKLYDSVELSSESVHIAPKGSIAYKLGLLAAGACDFVISKEPKNIWDIAAGTFILNERGFYLYQNDKKIEKLEEVRYDGPLIWCYPEDLKKIRNHFK